MSLFEIFRRFFKENGTAPSVFLFWSNLFAYVSFIFVEFRRVRKNVKRRQKGFELSEPIRCLAQARVAQAWPDIDVLRGLNPASNAMWLIM